MAPQEYYDELAEDVDVTGENLGALDAGTQLPPGWFPAVIRDVRADPAKDDKTRKFTFEISEGDYAGAKAFLTLGDPDSADDTDKAKKSRDRRLGMATRLGLIPKDAAGNVRYSFGVAVGLDVAIKVVKQREEVITGGKRKWIETERTQVDYMGVYLRSDSRVPAELRSAAAAPAPAAGQTSASRPATQQHQQQQRPAAPELPADL